MCILNVMDLVELKVSGMTCMGCVRGVEKALTRTPGVSSAKVDLASALAVVEYDAARTSIPVIIAAVEAQGYNASNG